MNQKKKKGLSKEYLRYAGLGFEALACILLFVGGGYALDRWMENENPWFLLFFSLMGCAFAMYLMIRAFNKPSKK